MACNKLKPLNWTYAAGQHVMHLTEGRAVLTEQKSSGHSLYIPQIQAANGTVITEFPHGLDLEDAEDFVRANLIELDRQNTAEAMFNRKLISTLDLCTGLLLNEERLYHRTRLENIKRWFLGQRGFSDMLKPPTNDWVNHEFNWKQADNRYTSETFHGNAIITERTSERASSFSFGTASKFDLQIQDITGVILKNYYADLMMDFSSAEQRMRRLLADLEEPFVDEVYLDSISFTLQICQCVLSQDADLMHFARLEYIEGYLGEVLP